VELFSFYRLFQRHGAYSFPVLVEIRHPGSTTIWRFTNNMTDIVYGGYTYEATTIAYSPPSSTDGMPMGGSLEIAIDNNLLLYWLDTSDEQVTIIVRAIVFDDHQEDPAKKIREIGTLGHQYGTVTWNGERIVWSLGEDDRLQMVINPWTMNATELIG
jgi:hypothetical protein